MSRDGVGAGWNGRGGTRAWRRLRDRILQRDGHTCQLALPGCLGRATQAHHTKPWYGRPEHTPPEELQAACGPCNKRAGWTPETTAVNPDPKPWRWS